MVGQHRQKADREGKRAPEAKRGTGETGENSGMGLQPSDPAAIVPGSKRGPQRVVEELPPSVLTRTTATLCGRKLVIKVNVAPLWSVDPSCNQSALCGSLRMESSTTGWRGRIIGRVCAHLAQTGVALRSSNTILRLQTASLPSPTSLASLNLGVSLLTDSKDPALRRTKISLFFFPSFAHIFIHSSLSWGSCRGILVVFVKCRDPQLCTFGVLRLSCEAPAAPEAIIGRWAKF